MDWYIGLALSAHLSLSGEYNEIHPNVGVYLNDAQTLAIGAYYNSEFEVSTYVSYTYDILDNGFVEGGLVTGYSDMPVKPLVKVHYRNYFVAPVFETITNNVKNTKDLDPGVIVGLEWRY